MLQAFPTKSNDIVLGSKYGLYIVCCTPSIPLKIIIPVMSKSDIQLSKCNQPQPPSQLVPEHGTTTTNTTT